MLRSKREETEEPTDLTARLRQLEQLGSPGVVAPRRPVHDELEAPAVRSWSVNDVVLGGGRMYVVGSGSGPHFTSATWLAPARRPSS